MHMFWRRYGKRIARYGAVVVAIGVLAAVSFAAFQFKRMTREWYAPLEAGTEASLQAKGDQLPGALLAQAKTLKPFLLLVIGTDSRDGEQARSDTMMLAAVHPSKQQVHLVSIPRDSYMELPGKGYDKLNHAMAYGGPKLVKQSLERFFNLKIDRYVTIDFEGFRQVVDTLGGVQIEVKKRMKYTDPSDDTYIDLKPGLQTLNGQQALDYVRYRKSDIGREDSDYQRIARQQEIVQALIDKGTSAQALVKAFSLMDILGSHIKTDLTDREIASLLLAYGDTEPNALTTDTLTGADERIWHNGVLGWYHLVPKEERSRVRQLLMEALIP
ncbi:LCP family protein required for cell wall assembly [Brevibacillus aydinogluensis]|jgi:polyisoprenyl-teichoic acid--peptidoglycan teichoic acid transferase|uniref:LytR family transcriptional regulator n=1 Tax=Brevibacillus aydinogluensis TaxID=927786 RepID=A0AA48RI94_9BACL|nr:LCP family protein [Brevibacillus aydinogluensis]MDT3414239.1 LCP family protein required for cell wall assembly [Brevibacillus aydinogluensis]CAJ1003547.1 LytR family transcriptional regulator [Brevibacillus aydinogluensis]